MCRVRRKLFRQAPDTVLISSNSSLSVDVLSPVNSDKCSLVHSLNGSDAFICSVIVWPFTKNNKMIVLDDRPDKVNSAILFQKSYNGKPPRKFTMLEKLFSAPISVYPRELHVRFSAFSSAIYKIMVDGLTYVLYLQLQKGCEA